MDSSQVHCTQVDAAYRGKGACYLCLLNLALHSDLFAQPHQIRPEYNEPGTEEGQSDLWTEARYWVYCELGP